MVLAVQGDWLTLKRGTETMMVKFQEDKIQKYRIHPGVNLVCSIQPNVSTNALFRQEPLDVIPTANAYAMMYSGSFDFAQKGREKEMHVFSGKVLRRKPLNDGGYQTVLTWKRNGLQEYRLIYSPPGMAKTEAKSVVIATGPGARCNAGKYYVALMEHTM